jgi:hypothetical protein
MVPAYKRLAKGKGTTGIWANSRFGVCPIPQCPCHIHGMGADPRLLTWVRGASLVSFSWYCGDVGELSRRRRGNRLTIPPPMPHMWHGCCRLSFAPWFLVCKRGVSEGGSMATALWGTHSPCWAISDSPAPMPRIRHGRCPLLFVVLLWERHRSWCANNTLAKDGRQHTHR